MVVFGPQEASQKDICCLLHEVLAQEDGRTGGCTNLSRGTYPLVIRMVHDGSLGGLEECLIVVEHVFNSG